MQEQPAKQRSCPRCGSQANLLMRTDDKKQPDLHQGQFVYTCLNLICNRTFVIPKASGEHRKEEP